MDAAPCEQHVKSLVYFDVETTSLYGRPKITELSMLSVHVEHFLEGHRRQLSTLPRVINRLTCCFNPMRPIEPAASSITGLYNDTLEVMKDFDETSVQMILNFWKSLEPPICVLAHNGNKFDFPILKSEFLHCGISFPANLDYHCYDTLPCLRALHKPAKFSKLLQPSKLLKKSPAAKFYEENEVQDLDKFESLTPRCVKPFLDFGEKETAKVKRRLFDDKDDLHQEDRTTPQFDFLSKPTNEIQRETQSIPDDEQEQSESLLDFDPYTHDHTWIDHDLDSMLIASYDEAKHCLQSQMIPGTKSINSSIKIIGPTKPLIAKQKDSCAAGNFCSLCTQDEPQSYKLGDLFKYYYGHLPYNAHDSASDCESLLMVTMAVGSKFLDKLNSEKLLLSTVKEKYSVKPTKFNEIFPRYRKF